MTCGPGTRKNGSQCVPHGDVPIPDAGAEGNQPPTFAGITSVAPASESALQVTWSPATDDRTAESALRYHVYVATTSGGQNYGAATVTTPPGAQSALIGGLTNGQTYFIVVRAEDADGAVDDNEAEQSGAPARDTTPPSFAGATSAEPVGATEVRVRWSPGTDDQTPAPGLSYTVRWSTEAGGAPTGAVGAVSVPGATSVVVRGLPRAQSSYYFNVRASDAAGNSESNVVEVSGATGNDTTAPVFGGCTGVGAPGATKAVVSWDPALDDVDGPDVITYHVYAFTEAPGPETPFGSPVSSFVGGTQGEVSGLANDTTYYLVCRAADTAGNEDGNMAFRVTRTLVDGEPPTFGGITAMTLGATTVELSWDAGSDDQTPVSALVYRVYQASSGNPLDSPAVAQSPPGATVISLSGLSSSTPYRWVVRAVDEAGNESINTDEHSGTTKVSFRSDIEAGIFDVACASSGCHGTDNPQQGLTLASGFAYFSLVGVNAIQTPGGSTLKRVDNASSDPRDSYLYRKIDPILVGGTPDPNDIVGARMPFGGAPLTSEQLAKVALWIQQGAENN
ncbi:MAG: fibronectin type III domain-containing protein [Polyangiaceae bacterium]|nr:fibronectin type III domain-containing protein [Polyangiaceae bacterium]MCW5791479.1 fibronectin type III domain-containing protein [Polyangiaceae bacterium]